MSVHADASRSNLYLIPETVFGQTPATPSFAYHRYTGTTLKLAKDTFQSGELHGDRLIRDHRHGAKRVTGDISIELSATGYTDTILEALLGGTWAANNLQAGVVRRSFSFLRHFNDLDSGDKPFHYFLGCYLNTLNLTFAPNGMVTGTVGVIGKDARYETAADAGQVLGNPTTTKAFDGFQGSLLEGGSPLATVTELQLTIENGIDTRYVIGEPTTQEPTVGMLNITGQLTAYFDNTALAEKFVNETESSVAVNVADAAGNDYTFSLPRIVYNDAAMDESGPGPIMVSMPFQAIRDDVVGSNIEIDRTVA